MTEIGKTDGRKINPPKGATDITIPCTKYFEQVRYCEQGRNARF